MGLANAPATFQAVMNQIFAPYLHKFVVVYLDDILVYGRTPAEHLANLATDGSPGLTGQQLLRKTVQMFFQQTEVKFLGHYIGRDVIKVDPKR